MGEEIAKVLLQAKAVTLRPNEPFTYSSGIESPIYTDNRILLSLPREREAVLEAFTKALQDLDFDVIAGTATAGIAWAAWLARSLGKPMVYVRSSAKDYGKQKQVEGGIKEGQTALVIEDLVSTGGSSKNAVDALREAGCIVQDCIAIFSYGLEKANARFKDCELHTLTDLDELLDVSELTDDEKKIVRQWQADPEGWQ